MLPWWSRWWGKSVYGYQEKDLTLSICKKLVALSKEYNIEIITTRDNDAAYTLEERLNKSNSTDASVFLSVHLKKSTTTDSRDNSYELGINPKSSNYSKSILLASAIASKLKTQALPVNVVDHGKAYIIPQQHASGLNN
jgi:N-acetylmuramoyl-L-alanine amidase